MPPPHQFESAVAAIDCASYFRVQVHPQQADYYRYANMVFSICTSVDWIRR